MRVVVAAVVVLVALVVAVVAVVTVVMITVVLQSSVQSVLVAGEHGCCMLKLGSIYWGPPPQWTAPSGRLTYPWQGRWRPQCRQAMR